MAKIELLGRFRDEDGTEKFVFESSKGIIEITWIKNKKDIAVFCLPTHHYCNLGCKFCHLTEEGSKDKKMISISVQDISQALNVVSDSYIKDNKLLFSFMGVGEPFLNIKLIFDLYDYFTRNTKKIVSLALATMMLTPEPLQQIIKKVQKNNLPLKIHFSLHSPLDKDRKEIIPWAPTTIAECLEVLKSYRDIVQTNSTVMGNLSQFHQQAEPAEIHYTIIDQINDSQADSDRLIEIGHQYKIPLKLIQFNPTKTLRRSPKTEFWLEELSKNYGASVCLYAPPGPNIGSSCGQFTKHYYLGSNSPEELEEFENWKKKYEIPC